MKPSASLAGGDATILARPDGMTEGGDPAASTKRCELCGAAYPGDFVVCPRDASPLVVLRAGDDPLLGRVLAGTYRVVRVLGEGGMGKLYEAEHLRVDRRFALKVIQEAWAGRDDLLARFEREARVMSRIRSEYVVEVIDVLRTPDDRPCIVCEKLDGEDLEQRLAREPKLSLGEAVGIARQACRGLSAAHAEGVTHRDLKPSNLFLTTTPAGVVVKVLDFGVAKLAGEGGDQDLTRTGAVVGTPAYMAPEQARGATDVDARSDVYALGAVLYRMLTGRAPYAGPDASTTLVSVLERDPTRPRQLDRSIPEGVEHVIQSAMSRDPAARPQTAMEFEHRLAAFDPGGDSLARTPTALRAGSAPLPGGEAAKVTRAARLARPLALLAVSAGVVSAGVATASALGLLVAALRGVPRIGTTDVVLAALAGLVAFAGAVGAAARPLRRAWTAAPLARELALRVARALGAGLMTLGGLELGARACGLYDLAPAAADPLTTSVFVAASGLVTVLLLWRASLRRA
jgi:serine/threonine-protein kinase